MRIKFFGKANIREQREAIQQQLMEVATDSDQKVNEQAMMNVVNSLFNHIEDLEEFIYTARGVEYNECTLRECTLR
jgi:predicted metalloprotease